VAPHTDFPPGKWQALRKTAATDATVAALATLEGGFLGLGGERVGEGERQFLEQFNALVGAKHA
jgi:hypothetical protein